MLRPGDRPGGSGFSRRLPPGAQRAAAQEPVRRLFCRHGHPTGGLRPALGDVFHRHLLGPHDGGAH